MKKFNLAREKFYGTKRGLETEYANFVYRCKKPLNNYPVLDPEKVLPLLLPAIESQIAAREQARERNEFVPPPKNFQTWINNRCWEEVTPTKAVREHKCCVCGKKASNRTGNDWFCSKKCRKIKLGW